MKKYNSFLNETKLPKMQKQMNKFSDELANMIKVFLPNGEYRKGLTKEMGPEYDGAINKILANLTSSRLELEDLLQEIHYEMGGE